MYGYFIDYIAYKKIEPHGSLTAKEIKKKHSSRPVGGVETGSWGPGDSRIRGWTQRGGRLWNERDRQCDS